MDHLASVAARSTFFAASFSPGTPDALRGSNEDFENDARWLVTGATAAHVRPGPQVTAADVGDDTGGRHVLVISVCARMNTLQFESFTIAVA